VQSKPYGGVIKRRAQWYTQRLNIEPLELLAFSHAERLYRDLRAYNGFG
jgi:hypothetical protein